MVVVDGEHAFIGISKLCSTYEYRYIRLPAPVPHFKRSLSCKLKRFHRCHAVSSDNLCGLRNRNEQLKQNDDDIQAHYLSELVLVRGRCLFYRIIHNKIEENVKPAKDTANSTSTLQVDEQTLVHKLYNVTQRL